MQLKKREFCQHCGGPLELSLKSGGVYCPTCDAANNPKDATGIEHKNKIAEFIHKEIVAGGGDMTYAEVIKFNRRMLIAVAQAIVLTPILLTGFFLFNEAILVGFSEAFTWRKIVGFWDALELWQIVGMWAVVIFFANVRLGRDYSWGDDGGDDGDGDD